MRRVVDITRWAFPSHKHMVHPLSELGEKVIHVFRLLRVDREHEKPTRIRICVRVTVEPTTDRHLTENVPAPRCAARNI